MKGKKTHTLAIALVGLVGSGKTTTALALAPLIRAKIVSEQNIRIELRNEGKEYDARMIFWRSEFPKR